MDEWRDNEVELRLAGIWAELLFVDQIRPDDNFFALGGDSLAAVDMVASANQAFRCSASVFTLFDHPTLAEYAAQIRRGATLPVPSAPQAAPDQRLALSGIQRWLFESAAVDPALNNLVVHLDLDGELDPNALEGAVAALVARHEILRARLDPGAAALFIDGVQRSHLVRHDCDDEVEATERSLVERTVDPDTPLFSVVLTRRGERRYTALIQLHHGIADRESLQLIVGELVERYDAHLHGREPSLPEASPYRTFTAAEIAFRASPEYASQVEVWRERLVPNRRLLRFEGARAATTDAQHASVAIGEAETAAIRRLAAGAGTTLFTVLFCGFGLALQRLFHQEAFGIGVTLSRRDDPRFRHTIGPVGNPVLLPVTAEWRESFDHALRAAAEAVADAWRSAEMPLIDLLDGEDRRLFNVMYDHEKEQPPWRSWSDVRMVERPMQNTGRMLRDLSVRTVDCGTHLSVNVRYRRQLFTPAQIESLMQAFRAALSGAVVEAGQ